MALQFENGNLILYLRGLLEDKITITSMVYGDIYPTKYMEKQLIRFAGQNFSCHKTSPF